jgi:hypothetical protein
MLRIRYDFRAMIATTFCAAFVTEECDLRGP